MAQVQVDRRKLDVHRAVISRRQHKLLLAQHRACLIKLVHADPLQYPLPHFAERLASKAAVKIVAIGSSSTAGEGGIAPYPERLQEMLRQTYPNSDINVINKGVSGQEAPDELARMQDVIDEMDQR